MPVAVFTMVYNESKNLPVWMAYYGKHFGAKNCFIIDHGSTDGSTDALGDFNVIRLPRSPQDNPKRTAFVNHVVGAHLLYFDLVIYTDCDEILVADPRRFPSIRDYCEQTRPAYITSIGLDLLHKVDEEKPLDTSVPLLNQRAYVHYSSAMNKPNISSIPMRWDQGFHSREVPSTFGDVFLFHLRYADLDRTLERLAVTRAMPWAHAEAGSHQRIAADVMTSWMQNWGRLPILEDDPLRHDAGCLAGYLAAFQAQERKRDNAATYTVDTLTFGSELIRLPAAFRDVF